MAKTASKELNEVLSAVEALRQDNGLSRRQISDSLGIPYETFKRWFFKKGANAPSRAHLSKLRKVVEEKTQSRAQLDQLWKKIRERWRTQHRYSSVHQLAEDVGWTTDGLRACLQNEFKPPRLVVERLAQLLQLQIPPHALSVREARQRSERLKMVLSILADELAWFRDGPANVREVYRSQLDEFDVGYLSSLLTMLFAEDKFRRWLEVTTNRFNYFKSGKRSPR